MIEQIKEQQLQSDCEQEQMALREYHPRTKEAKTTQPRALDQVGALQNSSTQIEGDPESKGSLNLHALNELISRRIIEAKLP